MGPKLAVIKCSQTQERERERQEHIVLQANTTRQGKAHERRDGQRATA